MFIDEIVEGLAKITDAEAKNASIDIMFENVRDASPDEIFLANVPISLLKLVILAGHYRREFQQVKSTRLRVEAQILDEEKDEKKCTQRVKQETASFNYITNQLRDKDKILMDLFWLSIHEEVDSLRPSTSTGIGLRKGWKFYSFDTGNKPDVPPHIKKIIDRLLGPLPEE